MTPAIKSTSVSCPVVVGLVPSFLVLSLRRQSFSSLPVDARYNLQRKVAAPAAGVITYTLGNCSSLSRRLTDRLCAFLRSPSFLPSLCVAHSILPHCCHFSCTFAPVMYSLLVSLPLASCGVVAVVSYLPLRPPAFFVLLPACIFLHVVNAVVYRTTRVFSKPIQ